METASNFSPLLQLFDIYFCSRLKEDGSMMPDNTNEECNKENRNNNPKSNSWIKQKVLHFVFQDATKEASYSIAPPHYFNSANNFFVMAAE